MNETTCYPFSKSSNADDVDDDELYCIYIYLTPIKSHAEWIPVMFSCCVKMMCGPAPKRFVEKQHTL